MDRPNYYAIIPAEVRYSNIKPSAKLLYGEITCLSNLKGYCYATNNYFSLLYKVSKNTISLWIKSLNDAGFIQVEMMYKGKQIIERRMTIINFNGSITKNGDTPITKNGEVNSTRINTTSFNITKRKENFIISISLIDVSQETKKTFAAYWTEPNHSKTKLRFELEKTWDTEMRLKRWAANENKWDKPATKSKLETNISAHQKSREMIQNMNKSK
tara:strand:+ start:939 stop:1583 length:645 start_codon:yes stop_codon:yes gene_type:complete